MILLLSSKEIARLVQHAFENNEVTTQVSLLADIAEDLDTEIYYNLL